MPPQKPSPHRFIAPTTAQTPKPKPKSNLRHAISATPNTVEVLQFKKLTPAKRFVVAPTQRHVADGTVAPPHAPDRVESPTSSAPEHDATPRPKARKLERAESIEEAASSPSRPTHEDAYTDVIQTIELQPTSTEPAEDSDDEMLFPSAPRPKRRRSTPPSPAPETPLQAPHRFRFPHLTTTTSSKTTTPSSPAPSPAPPQPQPRPHFLLPAPRSPAKPPAPLPEIFSPSRRGRKYLTTGLASSMQACIIDAAQSGSSGLRVLWGRERDDGVRVRLRVCDVGGGEEVECWAGGVVFVAGEMEGAGGVVHEEEHEQGVRVLLAGQGGARGAGSVVVRVGSVVGIRAPTWEIDVAGDKWTVGVDWAVL